MAIVCCVGSLGLISTLKLDIFPSESAKYIEIYTEIEPGTPLDKVREAHSAVEQAITSLPDSELVSWDMTYETPVSEGVITLTAMISASAVQLRSLKISIISWK